MPESLSSQVSAPVQPQVTSYDHGYEYSLEYWEFLRRLVEEEDAEVVKITDETEILVSSAAG